MNDIQSRSLTFYRQRLRNVLGSPTQTQKKEATTLTDYRPHWFTHEAINDYESRAIAITGGVGSGKSDAGVIWHWHRCRLNHLSPFSWVVSPTFGKLWDSIIPRYKRTLESFGYIRNVHYTLLASPIIRLRYLYSGHEVHFCGADRPDLMVAVELSHALIEEPGRMKGQVFTEITERVRDSRAVLNQTLFTGVPQGVTEYAELFDF